MRIVVTGATGNIGTALLRRLAEEGTHELVGVARRPPDLGVLPRTRAAGVSGRVTWTAADLTERDDPPAGAFVEITVADNGVGMPPEVLAHAFEPFFTTKPIGQGTGLGLSITYGIVREHDASIHCESAPGRGTRFTLRFRLAQPDAQLAVM